MEAGNKEHGIVTPWEPAQTLSSVLAHELQYSRGFLRSQLGQWFPGLGVQWLTLTHALGLDVKIISAQPSFKLPAEFELCFGGAVAEEQIAIAIDKGSASVLTSVAVPGCRNIAASIVLEYLARRFMSSILLSWGGPQNAQLVYTGAVELSKFPLAGLVQLKLSINGSHCSVYVLLTQRIIEQLDGLWRRQVRSSAGSIKAPGEIRIELAQLAVSPASIIDYTRSGAVVDLEVAVSEIAKLRFPDGGELQCKMHSFNNELVLENMSSYTQSPLLPEGTTRLSVQLGAIKLDSGFELAEFMQPGAMIQSGLPLSSTAYLVVNQEKIAQATVCTYDGRFAISVS